MHNPKLLIFDEPFSGFDPINANLIKDEILQLRDEGATVIFSTHRMESVEEMCDHIALIHKSNKILDGEITTIKREYKNNTFEVGVQMDESAFAKAETHLSQKFDISLAHFKSLSTDLKLRIVLGDSGQPNDLFNELRQFGQINHFVEVIPSVNDIFIQTVNQNV